MLYKWITAGENNKKSANGMKKVTNTNHVNIKRIKDKNIILKQVKVAI